MKRAFVRPLFVLAGLYDFVAGLIGLLAYRPIYRSLGVPLASQPAYVYFGASVLCIFGIGFWLVAIAPRRNSDIITMGVMLKLAFSGIVCLSRLRGPISPVWLVAAGIDVAFAIAFLAAREIGRAHV